MKIYRFTIMAIFLAGVITGLVYWYLQQSKPITKYNTDISIDQTESIGLNLKNQNDTNSAEISTSLIARETAVESAVLWSAPLSQATERISKKPFGIYIIPENSPIQPERFSGFHTGVDFEIFPGEEEVTVEVRAVCTGQIVYQQFVNGYGGTLAQSCQFGEQEITVLYGHLNLASLDKNPSQTLIRGERIGDLGQAGSKETAGERKHLHLGFIKGSEVDLRGYVSSLGELDGWLDPCDYVCSD